MRVVWRLRCTATDDWKVRDYPLWSERPKPTDFPTREAALRRGQFLERWRLVKVTIHPKPNKERVAVVRYLRGLVRDDMPTRSGWADTVADAIERGEHLK